jgi:hypothetical protein
MKIMKSRQPLILGILIIIISACSGSDTYRGNWKAMDIEDTKFEIFFNAKNFTLKDSLGKIKTYPYSQHSVEIKNNAKTYGIVLDNGSGYQINFPNSSNEEMGLIKDQNGNFIYTINRKDFVRYKDVIKLD